jgi:hypothetical protein
VNNIAATATHDAFSAKTKRGFSRSWTRRAVQVLRNAARNPFIKQARGSYGSLDANGHGTACATQILYQLLDDLRNNPNPSATLSKILPITHGDMVYLNDDEKLSLEQIADRIVTAAGGPMALYRAD